MSLILAHSFNENDATNVRDYSPTSLDGTGANLTISADTFGYYSDLNGTSSKWDTTTADYSDTFTLFFEVYIGGLSATDTIFKKTNCCSIFIAGSTLTFQIDDGATQYSVDAEFATHTWTKFACTYSNANGLKIYKDSGVVVNSDANNLSLTRGGSNAFGYDGVKGWFQGRLREFRIYNTEHTGANIAALMATQQGEIIGINAHTFEVGDLIVQSKKGAYQYRATVFATDTDEIRVLRAASESLIIGHNLIRCGNKFDTARQDFFEITGSTTYPEVAFFDGVTVHTDLDSDTAKQIIVNKEGIYKKSITKTANYTITNKDLRVYVDSSGGIFTLTLPASPTTNKEIDIVDNVGSCTAYNVTINGNGNNIIGSATIPMSTNYEGFHLTWNGVQWLLG